MDFVGGNPGEPVPEETFTHTPIGYVMKHGDYKLLQFLEEIVVSVLIWDY